MQVKNFIFIKYIFLNILKPFLVISLVLTGIVWLSRSLRYIDLIINKGLSQIIKKHFNTHDCMQFSLIETYANEKTDISNANKAFMDIINIQKEWYKRKNKNLSNTT